MNGINTEEMYAKCKVIVGKLATRYTLHFGDREAAIAEAYIILAERLPNYDHTLEIEKWAGYQISSRFRQLATQAKERREDICCIHFTHYADGTCHDFNVLEFLDELSPDGKLAANLVLDPPGEFAEFCVSEKYTLRTIRRFLSFCKGWKQGRISDAFAEIRKALSNGQ